MALSIPGGSGERAAVTLTRVAAPTGEYKTTPNYSLNHARSGSDNVTASTYPYKTAGTAKLSASHSGHRILWVEKKASLWLAPLGTPWTFRNP